MQTVSCVQIAYGEKYRPLTMYDGKRDISETLSEEAEARSVREQSRQKMQSQKKAKQHEQER